MKKRLTALLLAAALAMGGAGCARQEDQSEIRLGVMYSCDIIPLAVMQQEGFDKKHGVTLDMQVFSSAKDRDAALQAGELDGVFTDVIGMCLYAQAGLDLRVTGVTDGDYQLVASPQAGVESLAGAAGQSVAISENTLIEYALDVLVEQGGFGADHLQKEVVPRIPDRLELLREGKIGLCLLPEPFATLALKDGAVRLGSANESGLYPAVCAFTADALAQKKGAVDRFYDAYDEAVDFVNATPVEQLEDVIIEKAGFPEELRGEITLPQFRRRALPEEDDFNRAIAWAAAKGLCSPALTPAELVQPLG